MKNTIIASLALTAVTASSLHANVLISEFMYNNIPEFIEFTNFGTNPVDFTGWSFDDSSNTPGSFDLSAFGIVAPGESVILTEGIEADFRTAWNLAPGVKIIGEVDQNLGRNDTIYLYDAANNLADQLAYGDQDFPDTIRTQDISGWASFDDLGTNNIAAWVFSEIGDLQGSWQSSGGQIGSPGTYSIPEPSSYALLLGLICSAMIASRKRISCVALRA